MNLDRLRAQVVMELRLTATNAESLFLIAGIPIMLLLFFGTVDVLPTDSVVEDPIDFLVPGVLALAVMSTSFVNLAISTGFDRHYGVLKRLGSTPLTRLELLTAKIVTLVAVQVVQLTAIVLLGVALGWPGTNPAVGTGLLTVGAAALIATVAFAGLGFILAGSFSGLGVLAAANALYLALLLASGMVFPLDQFDGTVRRISELLPSTALAEILHGALRSTEAVPGSAWIVLIVWGAITPLVAAKRFSWNPS